MYKYTMRMVLAEARQGDAKSSPGPETVMGHQKSMGPYQLLGGVWFI